MRKLICISLAIALVPLVQSCVVAAGVVGGAVLSQQMIEDNTYIGQLNVDATRAWTTTKTTLSRQSSKPIDVDDALRKATAEIDGATVTASVETYDLNKSVLRVSAKKYGFAASETAKISFDRIIEELDHTTQK